MPNWFQRPFPRRGLKYPKSTEKLVFHTLAEVERKIALGRLSDAELAMLRDSVFLSVAEIDELRHIPAPHVAATLEARGAAPGAAAILGRASDHSPARRLCRAGRPGDPSPKQSLLHE